jgi:hypothetical protein
MTVLLVYSAMPAATECIFVLASTEKRGSFFRLEIFVSLKFTPNSKVNPLKLSSFITSLDGPF